MLQISSYWQPKDNLQINILPEHDVHEILIQAKQDSPKKQVNSIFHPYLPKRLIEVFIPETLSTKKIADLSKQDLEKLVKIFHDWQLVGIKRRRQLDQDHAQLVSQLADCFHKGVHLRPDADQTCLVRDRLGNL